MATVSRPTRPFNTSEMQRRVRHPLQSIRGTIRRYVLLEGLLVSILYLSIGFWIGMALDFGLFYLFRFDWLLELQEITGNTADVWFRVIILGLFVIGLGVLITRKVIMRLFREFSDESVALLLEKRFPKQLGDRLITAVELADTRRAEKYGFSPDMLQKTIEDAADRVEQVPVSRVFNWRRLWKLAIFAAITTIGMYFVAMLIGMVCIAASPSANVDEAGKPQMGGARASGVGDWFGRFNGAVGTWFQREVLMQDEYWLRDAYVELIRFQDTPRHPGAMHVGRDEIRPDLHVRAFRWVHVDTRPAREYMAVNDEKGERTRLVRNHYGWRPLHISDLAGVVDAATLEQALRIPKHWQGWTIEVEDLDPLIPKNLVPTEWQGKTIGEIKSRMAEKDAATLDRWAGLQQADYKAAADRMFDWTSWTLDRIELQLHKTEVRNAIGRYKQPFEALESVFRQLEAHVADTDNRGDIRILEVPEKVQFFYRGETTANPPENEHDEIKDRGLHQRKYLLPLGDLKESVTFHVRAADFSTATKKVVLVPPTSVKKLTLQLDEPAYVHHRIRGDAFLLKGKKQKMASQTASVTGDVSTIQVKFGSDLKFTAETDRPLKGKVLMSLPAKLDDKSAQLPPNEPVLASGGKSFAMDFPHVTRPYEFILEFNDEDNVKGKRRILIRPKMDLAPEVFDMENTVVLRKPRVKKESKDGSGAVLVDLPIEAFLITPDAELPFKANLKDDYGLTAAYWKYEVQPVEFELSGNAGEQVRTPMVLGGPSSARRPALIMTMFQFLPDHASSIGMPAYLAGVNNLVALDIKNGPEEGKVDLVSFGRRMDGLLLTTPAWGDLEKKLDGPTASADFVRDHALTPFDHFYLPQYLKKLKSVDPQKEGQLHYQLKLVLETVDSNIETGPGIGRNKTPFVFLVVSENELLSQIALEEESLRDRLEGAEEKIRDAETIMRDIQKRFEGRDAVSFEAMIQRAEDANSLINKAGSSIREAAHAYGRIYQEMKYNNVRKDRQDQLIENIYFPLEDIGKAGGHLSEVDKTFADLATRLEADKKRGATHGPEHAALTGETVQAVEKLAERLNRILASMEADITWARQLDLLIGIEIRQRRVAEDVNRVHQDLIDSFLKGLGK